MRLNKIGKCDDIFFYMAVDLNFQEFFLDIQNFDTLAIF